MHLRGSQIFITKTLCGNIEDVSPVWLTTEVSFDFLMFFPLHICLTDTNIQKEAVAYIKSGYVLGAVSIHNQPGFQISAGQSREPQT